MAILTVNGVAIHDPSDYRVDRFDLSSAESGRTLKGKMVKDIVARKVRITVSWSTMEWKDVSILLTAVEQSEFINVRYPDPKEGKYVTKEFYIGDRSAPAVSLVNGRELWQGVSFEFIER